LIERIQNHPQHNLHVAKILKERDFQGKHSTDRELVERNAIAISDSFMREQLLKEKLSTYRKKRTFEI
jgi:hypothetical protein